MAKDIAKQPATEKKPADGKDGKTPDISVREVDQKSPSWATFPGPRGAIAPLRASFTRDAYAATADEAVGAIKRAVLELLLQPVSLRGQDLGDRAGRHRRHLPWGDRNEELHRCASSASTIGRVDSLRSTQPRPARVASVTRPSKERGSTLAAAVKERVRKLRLSESAYTLLRRGMRIGGFREARPS